MTGISKAEHKHIQYGGHSGGYQFGHYNIISAVGSSCRGQPACGRHRHNEHNARHGHGEDSRDRPPEIARRAEKRHPHPIPDRGGRDLFSWRDHGDTFRLSHFDRLLSTLANWTIYISSGSVILSFTFSVLTGIIFGLWPAMRASKMLPIEALRYE